jgi:histidine triad (HIT) family protein
MGDCIFCNILLSKVPVSIVYQNEYCTAFMDIQPVNAGHVLIIPNRHATYLADLDAETGAQMFRVAQQMAAALRNSEVRCEGVNFFLADGEAANQEVFHVHLHVFPRFKGDGFSFTFPSGYTEKPERAELDKTAQQIKQAL